MTKADVEFLERIWSELTGDNFSKGELVERVFVDGGHDMSGLTREDVLALLEGRFAGDWHRPAFSFSELLAYYLACGKELTAHQIVGWIFASFVLRDAIERGAAEWEMQFNFFIDGFVVVRRRLEIDDSVEILRRVFRSDGLLPPTTARSTVCTS